MPEAAENPRSAGDYFPEIYKELRKKAQVFLNHERADHTLSATALVHEAYLKLAHAEGKPGFENPGHFYTVAAEAMRQILIDHARAHKSQKRGGDAIRISSDILNHVAELTHGQGLEDILALDEAISRLKVEDAQAAQVVQLRFFAGLDIEQTAQALGVSARTVKRDWQFARGWLSRELDRL